MPVCAIMNAALGWVSLPDNVGFYCQSLEPPLLQPGCRLLTLGSSLRGEVPRCASFAVRSENDYGNAAEEEMAAKRTGLLWRGLWWYGM